MLSTFLDDDSSSLSLELDELLDFEAELEEESPSLEFYSELDSTESTLSLSFEALISSSRAYKVRCVSLRQALYLAKSDKVLSLSKISPEISMSRF